MQRLGKGVAFFIVFCGLFTTPQLANASRVESLNWLPLLAVSMNSFQPDQNCPQNNINDLQVDKNSNRIVSTIDEINWDLDCSLVSTDNTSTPKKQQSPQLTKLLTQLSALPDIKLTINAFNLTAKLLKADLSTQISINKTTSHFSLKLSNELLVADLKLNLDSKQLVINADIKLHKIAAYIELSEIEQRYLHDQLSLNYTSDLNHWHQGNFKVDWKGKVFGFSENVELAALGQINLFEEKIILSTFSVIAKQVLVDLSNKQSWKTGYIKLNVSHPAIIDFAQLQIDTLPLHLRIGNSQLVTKIERGKSKRIRLDKQKLPAALLQLAVSGKQDDLFVDIAVSLLNQKLTGKLILTEELASLQLLKNSINIKSLIESGKPYIEVFEQLEVEKGDLKFDLDVNYQRLEKSLIIDSLLNSDQISGHFGDIIFDGVNIKSRLNYGIDDQSDVSILQDEHQLKIDNLFVGLPIQALQIDAKIDAGKPVIQHFKARLLGGRLDFDDFKLNAPSQTILNIGGISLAEIIKYSAYPEIQSHAVIDGMLPLTLTNNGPEIDDGVIFARYPGGYIKVPESTVIKAMGRSNPALSFTLQILSDLQFDTMLGRISYNHDGESDLNFKIKGISPAVGGTQPINFNYSHNENILKLLQSLRINEALVRNIKEKY